MDISLPDENEREIERISAKTELWIHIKSHIQIDVISVCSDFYRFLFCNQAKILSLFIRDKQKECNDRFKLHVVHMEHGDNLTRYNFIDLCFGMENEKKKKQTHVILFSIIF